MLEDRAVYQPFPPSLILGTWVSVIRTDTFLIRTLINPLHYPNTNSNPTSSTTPSLEHVTSVTDSVYLINDIRAFKGDVM